jgi:hypothetical protein
MIGGRGTFEARMLAYLALAAGIWGVSYLLFGRFIVPRWKVAGKLGFYLAGVALLQLLTGKWALIWVIGHPALGIAGHIWWCRRHGINWMTCQPRERYLALRPWAAGDGFRKPASAEDRAP